MAEIKVWFRRPGLAKGRAEEEARAPVNRAFQQSLVNHFLPKNIFFAVMNVIGYAFC